MIQKISSFDGKNDQILILHDRAVGVATHSTEEVGKILLEAFKTHVPNFAPRAYLGDAAQAFANAAMSTFPSILIRLMCFIHVLKVNNYVYCYTDFYLRYCRLFVDSFFNFIFYTHRPWKRKLNNLQE